MSRYYGKQSHNNTLLSADLADSKQGLCGSVCLRFSLLFMYSSVRVLTAIRYVNKSIRYLKSSGAASVRVPLYSMRDQCTDRNRYIPQPRVRRTSCLDRSNLPQVRTWSVRFLRPTRLSWFVMAQSHCSRTVCLLLSVIICRFPPPTDVSKTAIRHDLVTIGVEHTSDDDVISLLRQHSL